MARDDYLSSAARSLALPVDGHEDEADIPSQRRRSNDYTWQRRTSTNHQDNDNDDILPTSRRAKWMHSAEKGWRRWERIWYTLTPLQQAGLLLLNLVLLVLTVLFVVYNRAIFAWLAPLAQKWRALPGGWIILWLMTFFVSFPPMVGYSSCVTIAGFVFGMRGWFVMATATVLGSTAAFVVSRGLLRGFVARLAERNKQFAALSLVLKHDGLKLLVMIRLCPLPYSLSNGAISTIPTVTWQNFAAATALASPKLLLGVFVGSRLGDLAENGDQMDTKTKIVSYVSIIIGVCAGIGTGYWVYARTKARSKQLEAEEAAGRRSSGGGEGRGYNDDDPDERAAVDAVRRERREEDGYSMHTTYEEDLEGGGGAFYRDEFTDDEDAEERDVDVFDDGDGLSEVESIEGKR